jgi:Domain of unknown function (DUF5063)
MNHPSLAIQVFTKLASGFCSWCESDSLGVRREAHAAVWLARLHAAALELPEIDGDDGNEMPEIPAPQHQAAERNLGAFNGWYYRTVFNPAPTLDEEPVMGDIGDDLMDTYKDIKIGSLLADQGRIEEAIWQWSFMHRVHWGKHAVGALAALHALDSERDE